MQIWQMRRPSSFCDPNVEFEAISKSQIRYKREKNHEYFREYYNQ